MTHVDTPGRRRRQAAGDPSVECLSSDQQRLVEQNLDYVAAIANQYRSLGLPIDDLIGEGTVGLLEASRHFDPGRNTQFKTYATWWIRKCILRALSDNARLIRTPWSARRQIREVRDAERRLRMSLGRVPTREELADRLSISRARLERILSRDRREVSTAQPLLPADGGCLEDILADERTLSTEERLVRQAEFEMLADVLARLSERERTVLALRFGVGQPRARTLREIGVELELSRERVRQIEAEAKQRIRSLIRRRSRRPPPPERWLSLQDCWDEI